MAQYLGVEDDCYVRAALGWFAELSGDPGVLQDRIAVAREKYRQAVANPELLGQDFSLEQLGGDKVASYLAQADALLHDRYGYDLQLGSRIVPFVKQIGIGVPRLRATPGAADRARRMLKQSSVDPESAIFELAVATRYAEDAYSVAFLQEAPGISRRPDFQVEKGGRTSQVECKRLQRGAYELAEANHQRSLFRSLVPLIYGRKLNIHFDVTYKREMKDIPADYLKHWVTTAIESRLSLPGGYPWDDDWGRGLVVDSDIEAVKEDTSDASLFLGQKMARLLAGRHVEKYTYNMAAAAHPDARDPRFVEEVDFASMVTWECISEASVIARARHIQSKLAEANSQLDAADFGIVHVGMESERDVLAADRRRLRNTESVMGFRFEENIWAVYLHYFFPRVTEVAAWTIDETVDYFCTNLPLPLGGSGRVFGGAERLNGDLPAWHHPPPSPLA